jgi:hypothetical protein
MVECVTQTFFNFVKRDDNHVTNAFADRLMPVLAQRLALALGASF